MATFGASADDLVEAYYGNETIKVGADVKDDIDISTLYMYDNPSLEACSYGKYYISSSSSKFKNGEAMTLKMPCTADDGYILLCSKELNKSTEYNYCQLESEYIDGKYVFNVDIPKGTKSFEGYLIISKKPLSEINGKPVQQTLTSESGVTVSGKFPKDTTLAVNYYQEKSLYSITIENAYFNLEDCSAKVNIPCSNKDYVIKVDNGASDNIATLDEHIFDVEETINNTEENNIDGIPLDEYKEKAYADAYKRFLDISDEVFPTIKSTMENNTLTFDYNFSSDKAFKSESSYGTISEYFYVGTEKDLLDKIYTLEKPKETLESKTTETSANSNNTLTTLIPILFLVVLFLVVLFGVAILLNKKKKNKSSQ